MAGAPNGSEIPDGFPSEWGATEFPSYGEAWDRAIAFGVDVSLLLENLERTPAERLENLQRVVEFHAALKAARRGHD